MKTIFNLYITIAAMFFLGTTAIAQNDETSAATIFNKSKAFFENAPVFEAAVSYTLFRDIDNPKIIEQYQGKLVKRNDDFYLKIHNTEFLLVDNELVKVNHDQNALEYVKGDNQNINQNPFDIAAYLNLFGTKKVDRNGQIVSCKLTTPKYTQLPYGEILLEFDKDTYLLKKQLLTLVNPGSIKDENGNYSKDLKYLSVEIKSFDKNITTADSFFKIQNYVVKKGNGLALAPGLNSYKLIDRTIK